MQDVFFLPVSKHLFLCSGKICLTLIKGSLMNHSTMVFLVVQLVNFITLENISRVESYWDILIPSPCSLCLGQDISHRAVKNMGSSEAKCMTSKHRKSHERDQKKIPKPCYYRQLGGGPVDLCIYDSHLPEFCLCFHQVQVEFVKNIISCKLHLLFILTPLFSERKLEQEQWVWK